MICSKSSLVWLTVCAVLTGGCSLGGVSEAPGNDIPVYTVTFNTAGGSVYVPQRMIAGAQVNRPADPVKAGFVFDNWYDAAAAGSVIAWPAHGKQRYDRVRPVDNRGSPALHGNL
jgi:hypothetical protein